MRSSLHRIIALTALSGVGIAPGLALALPLAVAAEQDAAQGGAELMVVTTDGATLRCGDQDVFYAVAQVDKGTVLQTAGTSGAYTTVVVPRTIGAFAPASEVTTGSGVVTLKVASRLRAPSQLLGLSGSWKQMYAEPLPAGTELQVIETLKNDAGTMVGYRVLAPAGPAGELPVVYIRTDALRPAHDDEARAFRQSQGQPVTAPAPKPQASASTPAQQPANPAANPAANQPAATPQNTPTTGDRPAGTDDAGQGVDTSLLDAMDRIDAGDGEQPVEISNSTPVPEGDASKQRTADDGRIGASKLEDLEAAFSRARSMPRDELDEALSELLAEFTRARSEAEDDSSLARSLDQRIEWINIRIQTRDQRRQIASALAQSDERADELAESIEQWQEGRAYQLVGRMVTSSVYTGKNLPLLYRVQGLDPITGQPRTIGYVAPGKDQDLRHLLGRVVGVIGTRTEDPSLRLTVVEPERIDPMPE